MVHRFLHVSDIHFGQEKDGTLVKHDHVRNALVADVKNLAAGRGPVSRILVTGDIAFSGEPDEYKKATEWLEKLTKACGCDETDVSPIPGNHDCYLKAISHQARIIQSRFRELTPEQVQADLHGISLDGEEASPFLPKLQAYREFARAYDCDFESPSRPLWIRHFDLPGGIKLKFFGLTSVQVSDLSDKQGHMVLGNEQYTIAEEENTINVVLVHHPTNWFIDKVEAEQHLHNNARVMMVGHEHMLNIQKTVDAFTHKEWLVIYAGAANPPEAAYSYTYNWLEFSLDETGGRHNLVVEVFPRVWVQQSVRFDADRTRLGASGESVKIEITCPGLHPAPAVASAGTSMPIISAAIPKENSVITLSPVSATGPSSAGKQGSTMSTDNAGFDRLRYLFWRYLDWRQRLQVLVQVDALPKTSDKPVPQTLERVALETAAKNQKKLYDLWESVMPLIPEEKRGPNPFQSNR
jgi:hypothetical protein